VTSSYVDNFLGFINESPTAFHATQQCITYLESGGFSRLREEDVWKVETGMKYYVVRSDCSIFAFIAGDMALSGINLLAAHLDSPCLKIKANPSISKNGFFSLSTDVYGSPLLYSWLDRDLGLSGIIYTNKDNELRRILINIDRPLFKIPSLALHLNSKVNDDGLVLNKQNHLNAIAASINEIDTDPFLSLLSREICMPIDNIVSFELCLYDLQPATISGMYEEFISSGRIDNLFSTYCSLTALLDCSTNSRSCGVVLFNNEETGSLSNSGARSTLLEYSIKRIVSSMKSSSNQEFERFIASSTLISSDMVHSIHPNFPEKTDERHSPHLNGGPVIKFGTQGNYASSPRLTAHFTNICMEQGIPIQKYVNRSDSSPGYSLGPFIATGLGIDTIDVGCAMLAMHSVREMCGRDDLRFLHNAFCGFLRS